MWVLWVLQMIAFCVIYIADSIPTFLELGFLFLLMHLKTKFQNGTWQLTWKYMGGADTWSMWFQPSMFHKTEQQSTSTIFNFAVRSFLIWFQKRVLHLFFLQKHFSMINSSTLQIQAKHLVFSYLPNLIVLLSGNDLKWSITLNNPIHHNDFIFQMICSQTVTSLFF